jgi:hypothetical protein
MFERLEVARIWKLFFLFGSKTVKVFLRPRIIFHRISDGQISVNFSIPRSLQDARCELLIEM